MMPQPAPESGREAVFPLLGLDVSQRRIGVAIAENLTAPPRPLFTYQRLSRARDLAKCAEWTQRYYIGMVVIGLPLNMDGTPGQRADEVRRFARKLQEEVSVPVALQDERLSTVEAEELLEAGGLSFNEREECIDAVAAALILQRYLTEATAEEIQERNSA